MLLNFLEVACVVGVRETFFGRRGVEGFRGKLLVRGSFVSVWLICNRRYFDVGL